MTRIAVITAGMSSPSATRLLADRLTDKVVAELAVSGNHEVTIDLIELRELAHPLADNLLTGFPTGTLAAAFDTVEAADALVVVTPVFAASYSGLFKMFFDVLEPELLRGKRCCWPRRLGRQGTAWSSNMRCDRCSVIWAPSRRRRRSSPQPRTAVVDRVQPPR